MANKSPINHDQYSMDNIHCFFKSLFLSKLLYINSNQIYMILYIFLSKQNSPTSSKNLVKKYAINCMKKRSDLKIFFDFVLKRFDRF
jgi:hypothetical protein